MLLLSIKPIDLPLKFQCFLVVSRTNVLALIEVYLDVDRVIVEVIKYL